MAVAKSSTNLINFSLETKFFNAAVHKFIQKYGDGAEIAIKRVGFELLRRTIIRTTRVCEGRMRNGWHITFHVPSTWEPKGGGDSKPDPGMDNHIKVLYLQNNVHYAVYHEWGTNRGLAPLLMLTDSVTEMRGELERFLVKGMEPLWNKEINGITSGGLTKEAKVSKSAFLKRLSSRGSKKGICKRYKGMKKRSK
jgi:hypothetical protein